METIQELKMEKLCIDKLVNKVNTLNADYTGKNPEIYFDSTSIKEKYAEAAKKYSQLQNKKSQLANKN